MTTLLTPITTNTSSAPSAGSSGANPGTAANANASSTSGGGAANAGAAGGGPAFSAPGGGGADVDYNLHERVLCYHGPLIYEAKVLRVQNMEKPSALTGQTGMHYYVHYKGWKHTCVFLLALFFTFLVPSYPSPLSPPIFLSPSFLPTTTPKRKRHILTNPLF